jgi:hypothetical protein
VADSELVAEPLHVCRHVEPVHDDQPIPSAATAIAALRYQHDDDAEWLAAKQPLHESDVATAAITAIQLQYKQHGDAAAGTSDDEPYDVIAAIPSTVVAAAVEVEFRYQRQQPLG